jgi:hypothetical protein
MGFITFYSPTRHDCWALSDISWENDGKWMIHQWREWASLFLDQPGVTGETVISGGILRSGVGHPRCLGAGSPYQQDSDSTELRIYGHH